MKVSKIQNEVIDYINAKDINEENSNRTLNGLEIKNNYLYSLTTINPDVVGWVKVNETNIDYAVTKSIDNEYYLTHNLYKEKDPNGWIYMDYTNNATKIDDNIILYGHNRFGTVYMKPEGKQYKKQISEIIIKEVEKQKWIKTLNEEYCYLDATVYFDKKGKDCDNIYKVIQDTITESGVVWEDDKYTWSRTNRCYIDKNNPRVEIVISRVNNIGIFDNIEDYKEFEKKCKICKRYKRNCSILQDCKDNRINENIELIDKIWKCIKFSKIINK